MFRDSKRMLIWSTGIVGLSINFSVSYNLGVVSLNGFAFPKCWLLAMSGILYATLCWSAVPDKLAYFGTDTFQDKEANFIDKDDGVITILLPQDFMFGCTRYRTVYVSGEIVSLPSALCCTLKEAFR